MSVYREAPRTRRARLADVGLTIGERVVMLCTPLLFFVPAVVVPVLFTLDLMERGRVEGWEPWAFIGGPLLVAALLGLFMVWIVRGFDLRQRVYEDGYEVRFRGRTLFIAFDDVRRLIDDSALIGSRRHSRVLVPSFALELGGGESCSVRHDGSFHGLSWSPRRSQSIYTALDRAYGDYLGARHLEVIGRGERCAFGRIMADREGLELGGQRVPWRDVIRIRRKRGGKCPLSIVVETAGSEPWSAPASEVPDHPALRVVCASLARR